MRTRLNRATRTHSCRATFIAAFFFAVVSAEPVCSQPLDAVRPIDSIESVHLEELTWMEVRDLVRDGTRTVIVPTGGIEQNGPYLALEKHNRIVTEVSARIARLLGHTLVAPVIGFVPEGGYEPPTDHMLYPGTISVRESTFEALLRDVCRSLKVHGFREIILIGDSGGNQPGLQRVVKDLSQEWDSGDVRVFFIPEYYNYTQITKDLEGESYLQIPEGIHDDLVFTSQLLAIDPKLVRYQQRKTAGRLSINGISLAPIERFVELGNKIMDRRAERTVGAIQAARALPAPTPRKHLRFLGLDVSW